MNDNEIIKAAVELADGWNPNGGWGATVLQGRCNQKALDALAAQLVRQWLKRHTCTVYTEWHSDPMKTIDWLVNNWTTS